MRYDDHTTFLRKKIDFLKANPNAALPSLPENIRYVVVLRNIGRNCPEKWLADVVRKQGKILQLNLLYLFLFDIPNYSQYCTCNH